MAYAFGELLGDIGKWLLFGMLLAALIDVLLPADVFAASGLGEVSSLLLMLVVGIPIYICASASTPVAAALVLKGLSPGAALVFLLAGPATNAATLAVLFKFLGRSATLVYLLLIATCSLLFGWLVNRLYAFSGLDLTAWAAEMHPHASILETVAAVVLLVLIARSVWQSRRAESCC